METKSKVLVTGANGLLGSHIVRELLKREYNVKVLVRKGSNLRALEGLNIEFFYGLMTQKNDVLSAAEGCDFLIHSAAKTSPKPSDVEAFKTANIKSTEYCVEAVKKYRLKRFVFVSTANTLGNGTKENPGNEEKPFMSWLKKSGYAYSKRIAQEMVLDETKNSDLDAVVVNPTFIIGKNDVKPSSGQIFSHIVDKPVVFYPPGGKNFVDAEAAATGAVSAMERGKRGECYLLAGENLTYKEFYKMTAEIARQNPVMIPIPEFILMTLGYIGDFSENILKIPVRLSKVNARMLCENNFYTPAKAMQELNLPLTPAREAAKKAIDWFRENNYL
jgi:dihydroflavonol-4-reductase